MRDVHLFLYFLPRLRYYLKINLRFTNLTEITWNANNNDFNTDSHQVLKESFILFYF